MEEDLNDITIEALSKSLGTDHVIVFNDVFNTIKVNSFLEFGLGRSTKIFLERCPQVASLEISSPSTMALSHSWYIGSVEKFSPVFPHWRHSIWEGSQNIEAFNCLAYSNISPTAFPDAYFDEIHNMCTLALALTNNKADICFVDSGAYGRTHIINDLLKRRLPIVTAHDTLTKEALYDWQYLEVPQGYVEILFPFGAGITFWVLPEAVGTETVSKLKTLAHKYEKKNP